METSLPPYAQASLRIEQTPSLYIYREVLLAESPSSPYENYDDHLEWVAMAPAEELLAYVEELRGKL